MLKKRIISAMFWITFCIYILIALEVFFRVRFLFGSGMRMGWRRFNFIPFGTIADYLSQFGGLPTSLILLNLLGNVLIFIPYGLYLQTIRQSASIKKSLLIILVTSTIIEVIQAVFGIGVCDVDDVILNFAGGFIGVLGYMLLAKAAKSPDKAKNIVTAISVIVGGVVLFGPLRQWL